MTVTVAKNDDTVYVPIPVNNPSSAYKASLHVLLKHFADFHHTVLKVVSDKYDIPFEEMLMTVMEDPQYQAISENPVISSLTYFSQDDVEKPVEKPVTLKKRKAPTVAK
jgi:hypothetical protein